MIRQWQCEVDIYLQDTKAFTYQGLQDCIRPIGQRGQVVHSLHNQSIFGLVMRLHLPSPALPEDHLVIACTEVKDD